MPAQPSLWSRPATGTPIPPRQVQPGPVTDSCMLGPCASELHVLGSPIHMGMCRLTLRPTHLACWDLQVLHLQAVPCHVPAAQSISPGSQSHMSLSSTCSCSQAVCQSAQHFQADLTMHCRPWLQVGLQLTVPSQPSTTGASGPSRFGPAFKAGPASSLPGTGPGAPAAARAAPAREDLMTQHARRLTDLLDSFQARILPSPCMQYSNCDEYLYTGPLRLQCRVRSMVLLTLVPLARTRQPTEASLLTSIHSAGLAKTQGQNRLSHMSSSTRPMSLTPTGLGATEAAVPAQAPGGRWQLRASPLSKPPGQPEHRLCSSLPSSLWRSQGQVWGSRTSPAVCRWALQMYIYAVWIATGMRTATWRAGHKQELQHVRMRPTMWLMQQVEDPWEAVQGEQPGDHHGCVLAFVLSIELRVLCRRPAAGHAQGRQHAGAAGARPQQLNSHPTCLCAR